MNAIVFIAFTASWCAPCKALHRDFDQHPAFEFVDVDASPDRARQNGVKAMPTIVAMRGGKEVGRTVGYRGKRELEAWMKRMSQDLSAKLRAAYEKPFSTKHDPRHLLLLAADRIDRLQMVIAWMAIGDDAWTPKRKVRNARNTKRR